MITGKTFNTIGMTSVQIGNDYPVWARVYRVYKGGGNLNVASLGLKAGDVLHAGTMVKYNGPGADVEIVTAESTKGAAEVDMLTVNTPGIDGTSGNVTVKLNGVDTQIAIDVVTDNTAEAVAKKIAAGSYSGWTAEQQGSTVIFTKSDDGECSAPEFDAGTTGVSASFEVITKGVTAEGNLEGVNGLVLNDVCIPEGCVSATVAVCYSGVIYADRVAGGGIPEDAEAKLPMIEFVHESTE